MFDCLPIMFNRNICVILADECSKKWRNLRDLHVKRLKAGVENLFVKGDERDLTFLNEIKER